MARSTIPSSGPLATLSAVVWSVAVLVAKAEGAGVGVLVFVAVIGFWVTLAAGISHSRLVPALLPALPATFEEVVIAAGRAADIAAGPTVHADAA